MSHDGRVVCPWHGACFNVKSGDIEDAPGLDSLYKWSAEIKDEKIVVTASQKELKSKVGRVVTSSKSKAAATQGEETVVIIGGGSGGIHTVESLRMVSPRQSSVAAAPHTDLGQNGFEGKIVLVSEESYAPVDRTKLSKALIDDENKLQWRSPDVLKSDFKVDFKPATVSIPLSIHGLSLFCEGDHR